MSELKCLLRRVFDLLPDPIAHLARSVLSTLRSISTLLRRRDPGVLLLFPGISGLVQRLVAIRSRDNGQSPHLVHSPVKPIRQVDLSIVHSKHGNDFFVPIAQSLADAFAKAGFKTELTTDIPPMGSVPVIVAPHEFFTLTDSTEQLATMDLGRAILFNTEQPHTHWFGRAWPYMREAGAVLDISKASAVFSTVFGVPSSFVPLAPPAKHDVEPAPVLETEIDSVRLGNLKYGGLWSARPIDVLFVGTLSRRREAILASLADELAGFTTSIRLAEAARPLKAGSLSLTSNAELLTLANHSKILLNIHRDRHRYFEWQRLVMVGMASGALVLTESTSDPGIFVSGEHYVEAPVPEMPEILMKCLSEPTFIPAADQTIERATHRLERIDSSVILRAAVDKVTSSP